MTLLSLSLFLILGTLGRYACRQVRPVSAEYYAEIDSLFAKRSAAVLEPADLAGRDDSRSDSGTSLRSERDPAPIAGPIHSEAGANAFSSPKNTAGKHAAPRPLNIDINLATTNELQLLPRVGPRTAERIVAFREAYGSFRSVDELLSVSGIGPKTLEKIRPHARLTPDSTK